MADLPDADPPRGDEPTPGEDAPPGDDRAPTEASRPSPRLRAAVGLTLISAVLVLGALGAIAFTSSRDRPASSGGPPRLAVLDGDGALTTMAADGSGAVRHDAPGVTLLFPAWSPDGTRIAAPGSNEGGGAVYVFDAGEASPPPAPKPIYASDQSEPFYLSWSPDGRNVTFLTSEQDVIALRVAPADGSGPDTVVRRGAPMYWDWIDPGRLLVHAGSAGDDAFLGEIGLDRESDAATEVAPGSFRPPAVSRDGRLRAYAIPGDEASGALVVERRDGGGRSETPIVGSVAFGFDAAGETLAWTSSGRTADGGLPIGALHAIDTATGADRVLLDELVVAFYWSPDGRTIAALRVVRPGEPGIDVASGSGPDARGAAGLRVDLAPARRLAGSDPPAIEPGYPLRLVFVDVASASVRSEYEVRVSELYALQVVPFFDQYALSHRTWSPDSAAIALPLVDDAGTTSIVVIPADGSDPRPIAEGVAAFWRP